jgi:lysophospholipase L1-like esterase
MIRPGSTVLFQGDSITDAGRDRQETGPNFALALGSGYCNLVASQLLHDRPGDGLRFYNRGISGHRVVDLFARWQADAIDLRPNLISILVGVNDAWHDFLGGGFDLDGFEATYRSLLDSTRKQLPDVQLILGEPFAVLCGVVSEAFFPHLRARQRIVKALAEEYNTGFVPCQKAMNEALDLAPADHWAYDGVHPTAAGHSLLARCWLQTVSQDAELITN